MLSLFPNRTLEELDQMDWNRFLRAMKVKEIGEIETIYLSYIQELIQSKAITSKQWERIAEHDRILNG